MKPTVMDDEQWIAWQNDDLAGRQVVRCKWLTCYAGCGLAGNGTCFAGGNWTREDCPEYRNDEEFERETEKTREVHPSPKEAV